jgi:hypothetical protein
MCVSSLGLTGLLAAAGKSLVRLIIKLQRDLELLPGILIHSMRVEGETRDVSQ